MIHPTTSIVIAQVVGHRIIINTLRTCINIYATIEIIHDYIGGKRKSVSQQFSVNKDPLTFRNEPNFILQEFTITATKGLTFIFKT
jgi:hypothetical protein